MDSGKVGKVLGGAVSGFATGGVPGAIVGGLVGALAGGGGSKPETKPPQKPNTNQQAQSTQGTQTANSNQGTQNADKGTKVAIKADKTVEATSQDAKEAAQVALATRQALDANPPTGQGGFNTSSGQASQSSKGTTISFTT